MAQMRLDKLLSELGEATRSQTRSLLQSGRVTVDGALVTSPELRVDPERQIVGIDGRTLVYMTQCCYMLNKPAGVLSATEDARERTVLDLFDKRDRRPGLFPVGRLDKDTEGLLIITDDGALAHRINSPKSAVFKTYYARCDGFIPENAAERFKAGLRLADGTRCLPAELEVIENAELSRVLVKVSEGKFHQVKKMMAAVSAPVVYLKRLAVGALRLDESLAPGSYRLMSAEEIKLALEPQIYV